MRIVTDPRVALVVVRRFGHPDDPGWYAEAFDRIGRSLDWSESSTFPVDLDAYAVADWRSVWGALKRAYPNARIELTGRTEAR